MINRQNNKIKNLEELFSDFSDQFSNRLGRLKNQIIVNDKERKRAIDQFGNYMNIARNYLRNPQSLDHGTLQALRTHLKGADQTQSLKLEIDKDIFIEKLNTLFHETVRILPQG